MKSPAVGLRGWLIKKTVPRSLGRAAVVAAVLALCGCSAAWANAGQTGPNRGSDGSPAEEMDSQQAWRILSVRRNPSIEEIRRAFRAAIRRGAHPDVGGNPQEFRELRVAYDTALGIAEGRLVDAPKPRGPGQSAAVNEERPTEVTERSPSLHDFLQFRKERQQEGKVRKRARQQALRQAASRREDTHRLRSPYAPSARVIPTSEILNTAPTPEAKEAWLREIKMESIFDRSAKRKAEPLGADMDIGSRCTDELVGHRVVRAGATDVKVPIYRTGCGDRYYVSPLTSKRVTMPR